MQKNFVSEADKFIEAFDKKNPRKSQSQLQEIKKFERIFKLRDNANPSNTNEDKLWSEF